MKTLLRILSLIVAIGGGTYWFAAGHNTGWSKDHIEIMRTDPVTEIEYPEQEKRFVPGIEILGAVMLVGGALLGWSFLPQKK